MSGAGRTRRAEPPDASAVAELWLRSRRASAPRIPPPVHSEGDVRQWFETVVVPHRETWVVEQRARLIGMMVLEGGWIDQLYVEPGHTGRGVGGSLVELAKERSPSGLDLWTFAANVDARRFYERHGFVEVGATDGDNEEGAPDVHYRWEGGEGPVGGPVSSADPAPGP